MHKYGIKHLIDVIVQSQININHSSHVINKKEIHDYKLKLD